MINELMTQLAGDAPAPALSALCEQARQKIGREEIDCQLGDRSLLHALLKASEPKTRKNAARLTGALLHEADAPVLIAALAAETTMFVVPSILLALGSVGGEQAHATLEAYAPKLPENDSEEKHCAEIAAAHRKALAALSADEPLPVYGLTVPRAVLLTAPEGFSEMLYEELKERGYDPAVDVRGAIVVTENLQKLFAVRCFYEAFLPLAQNVPLEPEAIAKVAARELTLPYRIELRDYAGTLGDGAIDRGMFIAALTKVLGGDNNPSHYALELRVVCHGDACDLLLKPASIPDGRFSYRAKAIPASIAPSLAACIARMALKVRGSGTGAKASDAAAGQPGLSAAHGFSVLDPFCGSGTLLFELEKRAAAIGNPCDTLLGIDIAAPAITAARVNGGKAHSRAVFVQKDILSFIPRAPVDLIVSNLPFGNRVGNHKNNEALYRDLCSRLPGLLADGGVCVLYTMEYRLLSACLKRVTKITLVSTIRTEAGGLLPWIFVLRKKS
ncbi:MAG: methyltransferase domain-containing protein [Clostridia bacterium]